MIFEPKHKIFKDQYKIKERAKKNVMSGATCQYYWLLNDNTFRQLWTGDTVPLSRWNWFFAI
jgi:hypothetical protein